MRCSKTCISPLGNLSCFTLYKSVRSVLPPCICYCCFWNFLTAPKEVLIPVKCYYVTNFYVVLKGLVYFVSVTPCYCQILFHFSTDVKGPMTGTVLQPWHCGEMDPSLITGSWKRSRSHLLGVFIILPSSLPAVVGAFSRRSICVRPTEGPRPSPRLSVTFTTTLRQFNFAWLFSFSSSQSEKNMFQSFLLFPFLPALCLSTAAFSSSQLFFQLCLVGNYSLLKECELDGLDT